MSCTLSKFTSANGWATGQVLQGGTDLSEWGVKGLLGDTSSRKSDAIRARAEGRAAIWVHDLNKQHGEAEYC